MKSSILVGLIAATVSLVVGYKIPKNKNVGYVMISGRITNMEQAKKYFERVQEVVVNGCGATTLSVDFNTDIREGYDGPYQEIIPLRKGAIDMNFRIVERNR